MKTFNKIFISLLSLAAPLLAIGSLSMPDDRPSATYYLLFAVFLILSEINYHLRGD